MDGDKDEKIDARHISAPYMAESIEKTQISKYPTKGGHGFAAEDANTQADKRMGREAEVVGKSNESNGTDRIVDGVMVQSKYCKSAYESVNAAFDARSGNYRYEGQVLEVPKDQYDASVELIREKIEQGKVPGYKNPADANKLVKSGTVTYERARDFARPGNIHSLVFDAKTQSITSSYVAGLSFAVTFAHGVWRGEDIDKAIKDATSSAIHAGNTTFITGVVSSQVLRTRAAAFGVVHARNGVKAVSHTSLGREAIPRVAAGSLGKSIHGAAAVNHVAKLLRTNLVTSTISVLVTSAPDFYRAAFDRSESWTQFTKNLSVNIAGVASGTAGWIGGAAAGAALGSAVPVVGTVAGGVVGGIVGALGSGFIGAEAAKKIANVVVDDDSKKLMEMLDREVQTLAIEYLITETEFECIASKIKDTVNPKWLRRMFKETRKGSITYQQFIRDEFEPHFQAVIRRRPKVTPPSVEQIQPEITKIVEMTLADADTMEIIKEPSV